MNIPSGWKRQEVVRKKGLNAGKVDIYITSPGGKTFRSKKSLEMYIKEKKLPHDIKCFNFTTKNKVNTNPPSTSSSSLNSLNSTQSSECSGSFENSTQSSECYGSLENTISDLQLTENETKCIAKEKCIIVTNTNTTMTQTEFCSPLITTCAELLSKQWLTDQTMHVYLDTYVKF